MRPLAHAAAILILSMLGQEAGQAQSAAPPVEIRAKGKADAPVTVYEMSDFQCPFCRRHATEVFPILEREYIRTGRVRWVFVNLPLTSLHPNAAPAAELAMCAARAGKFWPVHDLLFQHQQTWAPLANPSPFFLSLADSAGIPRAGIEACLEGGQGRADASADAEGAARTGARSTPTFYIEGGLLRGAHPVGTFRTILDSVLKVRNEK